MKHAWILTTVLRRLLGAAHFDDAIGDVEERYHLAIRRHSVRRARWRYRRDVTELTLRLLALRISEIVRGFSVRSPSPTTGNQIPAGVRGDHTPSIATHQGSAAMTNTFFDLRIAFRTLAKTPLFAAAVVLTLALGVGANAAIFSAVKSVLFNALGYPDEGSLMVVFSDNGERGLRGWSTSYQTYLDMREQTTTANLTAFSFTWWNVRGNASVERIGVARVSANFWNVVGVGPAIGRPLSVEEDQAGAPLRVVLSHELWERQFGSDSGLVGKTVPVNGLAHTVIGIMPRGFRPLDVVRVVGENLRSQRIDAYVQLASFGTTMTRGIRIVMPLARAQNGAGAKDVQREMDVIYQNLAETYATARNWNPRVETLREQLIKEIRPALFIASSAGILILLLSCVNISSLVLVRGTRRAEELAVRLTLGASRFQIARLLMIESVILGLAGGLLGGLGSVSLTRILASAAPAVSQAIGGVTADFQVGVITLLLTLAVCVAIGTAPALALTKGDPVRTLRRSGNRLTRATGGLRAFVVAEVALALTLLTSAGLLTRSFAQLIGQDVGYRADGVLSFAMTLSEADYPTEGSTLQFFRTFQNELTTVPGVSSVSGVSFYPPQGPTITFTVTGAPQTGVEQRPVERQVAVLPGFFETLGIPIASGRAFTDADNEDAADVVIVSEALAAKYWGDTDPVGQMITVGSWRDVPRGGNRTTPVQRRVIGVVGNINEVGIGGSSGVPMLFQPHAQDPWTLMTVLVRADGEPLSIVDPLRNAAARFDPAQPIYNVQTMRSVLDQSVARERFMAAAVGSFAVLALILAAFGIYVVISYSVALRTREIGIQMALGASAGDVQRRLLVSGGAAIGLGMILGILATSAITRVISALLYNVSGFDVPTWSAAAILLTLVAAVAIYLPVRRTAALDPSVCLRGE